MKTLEEKLIAICGFENAQEVRIMLADHFQIDKIELKTLSDVRITSDNTGLNTKVEFGKNKDSIPVTSILWTLNAADEIGKLTLRFL